jgi:matrixin
LPAVSQVAAVQKCARKSLYGEKLKERKMKNIEKKIFNFGLCLCLALANVIAVHAGGAVVTIDITNAQPSPIPGQVIAKVIGVKWDVRSIPVQYSMNNTLDPIPNPLGAPVLTLAQAQAALQTAFDSWNKIPASFIEMQITGTTANPRFVGFDFVNELTFRTRAGFTVRASSPSTSLIADSTFVDGDDIDEDGDSDVSSAITVCADVDGDGDIEFPAGFYKAGTILDNDVQFNTKAPATNGLRFTVGDEALDTNINSVDLIAVATHEFGHSHGMSHTMDNQISDTDGSASVMVPLVDTGDPASEKARRSLSSDDIAWSSYFYPEGSARSGPASLQPGDKAFDKEYGLIEGELRHGALNQPIAGGSVFAKDYLTNKFVASGFSGTTQFSLDPNTGQRFLIDPAFNILNGNYVIPVPKGIYAVGIEAVDGNPQDASDMPLICQIGSAFGQQNFNEEFYNRSREDAREVRLGEKFPVVVLPGLKLSSGIDIVTSDSININNFGDRDTLGIRNAAPGTLFAVQIPASQITSVNPGGGLLIQGVAFDTGVADASVVPVFAKAALTTGTVNGTSVFIDLDHPLAEKNNFVGQDGDLTPFYFRAPRAIGAAVLKGIERGEIQNLFIVLQVPTTTPFPGVSGQPPFIGFDGGPPNGQPNDAPIFGLSFSSTNGGATWSRNQNFNIRFSLIVSKPLGQP